MQTVRTLRRTALTARPLSQIPPRHATSRNFLSTSQQPFRTRPSIASQSPRLARRHWSSRRFFSSQNSSEPSLSLTQRLRKLSREYGWSALGVYLALTALDFPFCFLAVRLLGTDRIGHWEHIVVSKIKSFVQWPLGDDGKEKVQDVADKVKDGMEAGGIAVPVDGRSVGESTAGQPEGQHYAEVYDHGYREAEEANTGAGASLWTQLALAYAIHKSFIFVRVPLTAAITPKVVRVLRGWGWDIGKRKGKTAIAAEGAGGKGGTGVASAKGTGVNTNGKAGS